MKLWIKPLAWIVPALMLAGCGALSRDNVEYKSASKGRPLEVPPDLVTPGRDDRFNIPASGTASRAEFERSRTEPRGAEGPKVLPSVTGMRIERQGDQRVLVVDQSAERLWPVVRQFWLDSGFVLTIESPETGIIETDWVENRAKIPEDILRRTLGRVIDRLYDTGERDKFRTRIDRSGDQQTEIVITHRGVVEVVSAPGAEIKSTWTNRPSDRDLEAEFTRRLMIRLGADQERAKTLVAQGGASGTAAQGPRAQAVTSPDGGAIDLAEPFDRAWRRVGVAIDRLGFTVEDRDRAKGLFFVRYRDPTADAQTNKPGFFSRLFSSSPTTSDAAAQYRVLVGAHGQSASRVVVQDKSGKPASDANAKRMLALILEQLK
jgi:outer membrane protein assembly factor BamC